MSVPIYKIITEEIRHSINSGTLRPGDRIASIRELSRQYNVSQITVLRVFKDLAQEGKIIRRDGTGYFVADSSAGTSEGNTLIMAFRAPREITEHDNFINRISEGMMTKALEQGFNLYFPKTIFTLRGHSVSDSHMENLLHDIRSIRNPAGLILDMLYPDAMIKKHILPFCGNMPCVVAGRRSELPVKTVSIPFEKCAEDAALLALKSNAREFFIYEHANPWGGNRLLCTRFQEELMKNGIPEESIYYRDKVLVSSQRDVELMSELEQKILSSSEKILAFSSSDYFSRDIMARLHGQCLFGTRASLISFGGFEFMMKHIPPVTSIVPNARRIGTMAVELILKNDIPSYSHESTVDYKVELNATL
ncbi:MAG: putative HTH-type transcriptional regulator YurK [Lentisphaerae bacterium ADurb.Bin242]|nr:MAG: putative HTH-type transcriptional regulator YurK [Lentisphaerae bacterium ADurb.Bin242]